MNSSQTPIATSSAPAGKSIIPSLTASAIAAAFNFPLWRASTIAHSSFVLPPLDPKSMINKLPLRVQPTFNLYSVAMTPPFPGATGVVFGMTSRSAIFYGSDYMKASMKSADVTNPVMLNILPSFLVSTFVQVVNMPLIRATITQQDPELKKFTKNGKAPSTISALSHLYKTGGIANLWHGTSAGLLKTVPKYVVSIVVKDYVSSLQAVGNAEIRASGRELTKYEVLSQSALKALMAGVSGAALTNPADVIRNEMFKSDSSTFFSTLKQLNKGGSAWMWRGLDKNLIAVSAPISLMIFLTDLFETFGEEEVVKMKKRITKIVETK